MTTVVTRAAKGSRLTWGEVDANFTNLNADKVETINPTSSGTLTHSGDIVLSGSGKRITGDFSNGTIANRVMFQTSIVNGNTGVQAVPNGSGTSSSWSTWSESDTTNASYLALQMFGGSDARLYTDKTGTGTYLPMTFYTGGSERMRIDTGGNVLVTNPAGLGYGTGAGGTVTQATSKSTAVTLNKPTGQITMNNAALAAGTTVLFALSNSLITDNDIITVVGATPAFNYNNYQIYAVQCYSGTAVIAVKNVSAGSLSEAIKINFAIIKGANA